MLSAPRLIRKQLAEAELPLPVEISSTTVAGDDSSSGSNSSREDDLDERGQGPLPLLVEKHRRPL